MTRYRCVMLRRSGASEIRVVRAEDEAAARAQLAAKGLEPVSVEAIGPSLLDALREKKPALPGWRLPRWNIPRLRVPQQGLIAAGLILATIPVSTALGAWGLTALTRWQAHRLAQREAPALARYERVALVEGSRRHVMAVMTSPPVSAVVVRLARLLPPDTGLAAVSLDEGGALVIEVETPDPDALRGALAADPLFAGLDEVGQTRTDEATLQVTLKGAIR
ncbi:hypothetical protein [Rhizorhabdus dicambivorans]|nr:hypothetical protein [Rhizorhabdus dicambivorans]ATE63527.1 hypothetical protein CMV14_03155 [Rhizorhabdus dicambivorans]